MLNNECRISNVEGRCLTILLKIKNRSEAIPPFVIHYSIFKNVITATVPFKSIRQFGSPLNRDFRRTEQADKSASLQPAYPGYGILSTLSVLVRPLCP